MSADDWNRLLPPLEVGEWLGVPTKTLAAWRHTGRGPRSLRVGRHVRYRREDVLAFIEAQAAADLSGRR